MNQNVLELIAHYCNNDQIACLFRDRVITEEMALRASKFEYPKGECKRCWFYLFAAHYYSFDLNKNRFYTLDKNTHFDGVWQVCSSIMYTWAPPSVRAALPEPEVLPEVLYQVEKISFLRDPEMQAASRPEDHLDFLPERIRELFIGVDDCALGHSL